jgi:hypothetical protein
VPDWVMLTRILPYVRHKISLSLSTEYYDAGVEDIQGLARAIHGHPMIAAFRSRGGHNLCKHEPLVFCLGNTSLSHFFVFGIQEPETDDQRDLVNVEPLKELLRTPALRFVAFSGFDFTNELFHAKVNALGEGSSIIDITFECNCSFPDGGKAIIAKALKTNASVTDFHFFGYCDEPFCDAMTANLTLRLLEEKAYCGRWISST